MIVVDASILATALLDDSSDGDLARERLLRQPDLHAPHLLDLEVLSVFRRRWGRLDNKRMTLALKDFQDLRLTRYPHLPFADRIIELGDNLTVYDAAYVALAEALQCTLLTADRKLARAPGPICEFDVIAG